MLKVLAIALAAATIVVSGVAVAKEKGKVYLLTMKETVISEKLLIVPVDKGGLVQVADTKLRKVKKEIPKS